MDRNVKLPVRQLVEFVLRGGSIDNRFGGMDRANEGARIHRRLQKEGGEQYQAECFLTYTCDYKGIAFTVDGRADGIIAEGDIVRIDEIKTTGVPLDQIHEDFNRLHWAQAMCYAYFYALQNSRTAMIVQLTYVHVGDDDEEGGIKRFERSFTLEELTAAYEDLLERYKQWADFTCEWALTRTQSIKALPFPFEQYRRGQRSLAVTVYQTIAENGIAFCQAPTGIGKTISTLFPAVKSMGEGIAEKIFYLTAKTITRQAAEEALSVMRERGLRLKSVTLTAKDKICFLEERTCNPEQCPYANGHFDRVNATIYDLIRNNDHLTRETIETAAREHRVCPFELSLDLTLWSDCVICDYNYLFDPIMYLKRFFSEGRGEYVFLVDEAHNLVDRAREMYSAVLKKTSFYDLKKKLPKSERKGIQLLDAVNKQFIALRKLCGEDGWTEQKEPNDSFNRSLELFINRCEEWLRAHPSSEGHDEMLQLYFDSLRYLKIAELYDDHYLTAVETDGRDVVIRQCCLDPSDLLREAMERGRAAILFSATLTPLDYFSKVLGGDESSRRIALPSPFERDNLKLLIANHISTRYKDREQSIQPITELIMRTIEARTGNYMVYFPSYQYMNEVYTTFCERSPQVDTLVQRGGMDERERETFLARFDAANQQTLVGFCVLGGIYSEGIDLKGDRLIGTVIVGVGLPQIGREQDRIREYYAHVNGDGYAYAYQYPGMNKVLQAAGRVIRGENDHGVVLLIDDRFNTQSYLRLFPEHWRGCRLISSPEALENEIQKFWQF